MSIMTVERYITHEFRWASRADLDEWSRQDVRDRLMRAVWDAYPISMSEREDALLGGVVVRAQAPVMDAEFAADLDALTRAVVGGAVSSAALSDAERRMRRVLALLRAAGVGA